MLVGGENKRSRPTVIVSDTSERKRKVDSTVELSSPSQVSASFNLAGALQALRQTDGEVEVMPVIATGVSAHEFGKWRDEVEKPGCKVCLQNGTIFAYELPRDIHAEALGEIAHTLSDWCINMANRTCKYFSEIDLIVPGGIYAPDCAITPVGRPTPPVGTLGGRAYPTLVVEVGYTQTIPQLHARAAVYFGATTDIRLYLAFKIYDQFNNGSQAMLAMFYQRANANPLIPDVISFGSRNPHPATVGAVNNLNPTTFTGVGQGGAACNAIGVAGYQIQLPAVELYHNVAGGVPAGVPANLVLDLFNIQTSLA